MDQVDQATRFAYRIGRAALKKNSKIFISFSVIFLFIHKVRSQTGLSIDLKVHKLKEAELGMFSTAIRP